jgi:UDP-4-amino-4,6-dideoxy-N-acetyl-beta-L-altrosamine transaminase
MIPYGRQSINDDDIQAVVDVLKSDFLTQGSVLPAFEQAVCEYTGAAFGVAVNSGTSALHIACLALGLGEGDYLWTTPITFVASANCGLYCGASVDFVDIDPDSWNLSVKSLEAKLIQAKKDDCLPKVLVAVHLCGLPCDMQAIQALSQEYGFSIIEDASHAIGGRYQDKPIGACQYSDITVFSFHPVKTITTGEGGMAVTNSAVMAETMALLRSHGITRDPEKMTQASDGGWYYQQIELGFNYRMTDLQAALGVSQLNRLDAFVSRRQQLADRYDERLQNLPLQLPIHKTTEKYSGSHLYVVRIKPDAGGDHSTVFDGLRANGIGVNLHYIPVHTQPYYQQMGFASGDYPEAENYYVEAISLPLFPTMTEDQQDKVIAVLERLVA